MYRYRYINKHVQFEATNYTLVLEDLEGDMSVPLVRIEKTFNVDPSLIDNDFLYNEARKDILLLTAGQSAEPVTPEKNLETYEQLEEQIEET